MEALEALFQHFVGERRDGLQSVYHTKKPMLKNNTIKMKEIIILAVY